MFLLLFVLWWIFSGPLTVEIILVGFFLSLILEFATVKILNYRFSADLSAAVHTALWARYFRTLVVEIVKCCLSVLRLIWTPNLEIKPMLRRFPSRVKAEGDMVVLANSITLTPGTITVQVQPHHFIVHALDAKYMEGIENSDFVKILEEMEKNDAAE
jgi:multicomponent Na+:H+ antiporter subunit E